MISDRLSKFVAHGIVALLSLGGGAGYDVQHPKDAVAFNNRGLAYSGKGEYSRAIADVKEAIKLNPKNAEAFYNRGNTYERKGDKVKAIESYRQALAVAQNPQVKEFAQRKLKELGAN